MSLESIHVSTVNIGTRRVVCICENIRLPSSPFALHARLARRQPVSLNSADCVQTIIFSHTSPSAGESACDKSRGFGGWRSLLLSNRSCLLRDRDPTTFFFHVDPSEAVFTAGILAVLR